MLICCVKKGEKYSAEYPQRLMAGVMRHLPNPEAHEFLCFTDKAVPYVPCAPLPADFPTWWSKLSVFRIGKPCLYLDLDIVITGDLTPAIETEEFTILRDWWLPGYNSSVMRLTGNETHVWDNFAKNPQAVMHRCGWGDQQWVTEQMPGARTFPAHWFPSYKASRLHEKPEPPEDAVAVIHHGRPKPHEITEGWVARYWVDNPGAIG